MLAKINNKKILGFKYDNREWLYHEGIDKYVNSNGVPVDNEYLMYATNIITKVQVDDIIYKVGDFVSRNNTSEDTISKFYIHSGDVRTDFNENFSTSINNIKHINTSKEPLNLAKLEELILSKYDRKIRLEKTLIKTIRQQSVDEFLQNFFETYNHERDTIFADTLEVQTEKSKRRSLGDIFMLCRYYFPTCTLAEVLELLYVNFYENLPGFRTSYCNQINKRVWYLEDSDDENEQLNKSQTDEYGYKLNDYIEIL